MLKQNAQVVADYLTQTFGAIAQLRYKDPSDAEQTWDRQAKWCINVYASEEDVERGADPAAIIYSATISPDYETIAPDASPRRL